VAWLYLLVSVVLAALTYNVYHPMRRSGVGAVISFGLGMVSAELALHHVAWQALLTVAFVAHGALDGFAGKLGLGISVISWTALAGHYLRAYEVRGVMERALQDALGEDYLEQIRPELRPGLTRRVDWAWLLRVLSLNLPGVERVRGIRYTGTDQAPLKLDVYCPRGRPSGRPVLLQIHGGGYVMGSKQEQGQPICKLMAARGWVCVNANYRLSPRATFPDQLVDMKRAIAWIRDQISNYGGDPDFVIATGGSAGGHLSAMVALTPNEPRYQPGFEQVDTRVHACVPFYGFYDAADRQQLWLHPELGPLMERRVLKASFDEDPERYDRSSPLMLLSTEAPPFFVIHGAGDSLIAPRVSRHFTRAARATIEAPVAHAEIPGGQHAFDVFGSLRTQLVLHGVERFLTWVYSRYLDRR